MLDSGGYSSKTEHPMRLRMKRDNKLILRLHKTYIRRIHISSKERNMSCLNWKEKSLFSLVKFNKCWFCKGR